MTRNEYIEKAKARLDQWDAKIQEAEAKAKEATADSKLAYQEQVEDMRQKRDEAREKLKELQSASEGAWGDFRAGVEKAWNQLEESFENATRRFR